MSAVLIPFPLTLVRQQAQPIDIDARFETTAARSAYLTSPRRYSGMIVWDEQEGGQYFLNKDKNAWIAFGGTNVPQFEIIPFSAVATLTILLTAARKLKFGDAMSVIVEIVGVDGKIRVTACEIIPDLLVNTTKYDIDFGGVSTGRVILK